MALDRKLQPVPAAVKRRPASTVQRSAAPTARTLQERLGNHGTQAFFTRAVQSSKASDPVKAPCACGTCPHCNKAVQRASTTAAPAALPPSVTTALDRSGGQSLPRTVRQAMESSFGRDFNGVRVFTDEHAATATRDAGARAFTSGDHIYFARGEYQPDSARGRELIAHELTHVAQQKSGRATVAGIGPHDDAFEKEAERAAAAVGRGERPAIAMGDHGGVVRRAKQPPKQGGKIIVVDEPLIVYGLKTSPKDRGALKKKYKAAAASHALRTTKAGRSGEHWQAWADTRPTSYFKSGQTKAQLIQDRKDQGCQVDHVLELQVGGSDDANNLRLLNGPRNMEAGRKMSEQIARVYKKYPTTGVEPILEFTNIQMEGSPEADRSCLDWDIARDGGELAAPTESAEEIGRASGRERVE